MAKRIHININTLLYYIEKSNTPIGLLQESIANFDNFLSGKKLLTYNQIEKISKLIKIPVGLLVLDRAVDINTQRLSFRTLESREIVAMSAELRDTIIEMQEKQFFYKTKLMKI